jgi:hypothetical protein
VKGVLLVRKKQGVYAEWWQGSILKRCVDKESWAELVGYRVRRKAFVLNVPIVFAEFIFN